MEDPAAITLRMARSAWLEDGNFRRLSPRTLREYDRVSERAATWLAARLGREPQLADLRAADIRLWLNSRPRPLQPASVAAYVRALRAFSRWCAREYGIAEPLTGLRPPRVDPPSIPVFRPEQLRALLDAAPLHLAYAITLLAETGLRVSEAIAVELADVDQAWITVRRGKGGRSRRVPVSRVLAAASRTYVTAVRPLLPGLTQRLLVNSLGEAWTDDALRRALRRLGQRAGIRDVRVSPHTFRHQFAHEVAFSGGSLIALRDVLGHRTTAMVERYAVPDDDARRALLPGRTPLHRLSGRRYTGARMRVSGDEDS